MVCRSEVLEAVEMTDTFSYKIALIYTKLIALDQGLLSPNPAAKRHTSNFLACLVREDKRECVDLSHYPNDIMARIHQSHLHSVTIYSWAR